MKKLTISAVMLFCFSFASSAVVSYAGVVIENPIAHNQQGTNSMILSGDPCKTAPEGYSPAEGTYRLVVVIDKKDIYEGCWKMVSEDEIAVAIMYQGKVLQFLVGTSEFEKYQPQI